ncbi:MAG: branched-chain amino acid ABC transporter substrate-binding protein, partial [Propionibacteriaceae bacterium]|nr:branched-chain amino acid ABC transporter substrate-binding protein [Propionibacteriaceae bacterium]
MTKSLTKKVLALVITIFTALSLSACGGGVAGGGGGGGQTPTGDTLKLGLIAPFSGSENMFGEYMRNGALIAIDELNAAGGVLGKQLELLTEDDMCDPTSAANAANKLVTDGVVASVGGYCSGSTLPTEPIFYNAGIPMIISVANSDNLLKDTKGNVFLIDGTGTQQAATALKWVEKNDFKKLVVIDDKTDYSANLAARFVEFAKAAGLDVTTDSLVPKEKDFSAQDDKIKSSGADFFYFTGYVQEAGLLVNQAVKGGYTGSILLGDGSVDSKVAELAGLENCKNVYATYTKTPDMLNDGGAFAKLYQAKSGGKDPGPYTIHSYDAVKVWADAATRAGSTEMAKVDEALKTTNLEGLTGPISFVENGSRSGEGGFVIVSNKDDGVFKLFDALA